jgi:hypothetical protein
MECAARISGEATALLAGYICQVPSEGLMIDGYAADDWVGLHFVGSKLNQVVSPKPNANAYKVSRNSAGSQEKVIKPDLL